ncbi:SOS response-associated peptidase [Sphingobacterium oryzagri]|uniref:Abasic site processing protein n=1 Tax=Sphingobacterium oryzagri TaxID=3025669 RepID=A0ABY7WNZ6_9SPHI|nr:SOS response-associated peptidase [Sphingobacterium sp. KACC 22765]WDF70437.1 SOS response-associated peptidase [Sphingobacterium sp. KACC 22765]
MCGRTLISEAKELAKKAGVALGGGNVEKDTNRPPGSEMPVILDARPGKIHYLKWGLIPSFASEPPKYATTYARMETIHSLSTYRNLVGKRHCVFVVEGFYEFDKRQKPSQPYYFQRKDKNILYLDGLWDTWRDTASGLIIPTCAMIMQPANALMSKVHDRMPCVMTQADALKWLDRSLPVQTRLQLLQPVENDVLEGWQVDKKVNNARNKDSDNADKSGSQLNFF